MTALALEQSLTAQLSASVEAMMQRRQQLIAQAEQGILEYTEHQIAFEAAGRLQEAQECQEKITELRRAISWLQ